MPEGPEVAVVTDYLIKHIIGAKIEKIKANYDWLDKCHQDNLLSAIKLTDLKSVIIKDVSCYCKRIFFHLDNDIVIVSALGMEGMWTLNPWRTVHISLYLSKNDKVMKLCYQNTRPIGFVICIHNSELEIYKTQFGFDVLSQTPDYKEFKKALKVLNNVQVKFIFNKEKGFVCSVGNYLRSEILYEAKINPTRKVSTLDKEEIENLRYATIRITRKAYYKGGMTSNSFYSPEKETGKFKAKVYNKEKDPFGNKIEKIKAGQSLYWVPKVQK